MKVCGSPEPTIFISPDHAHSRSQDITIAVEEIPTRRQEIIHKMLLQGNVPVPLRSPIRFGTARSRSSFVSAQLPVKPAYSIPDADLESRGFTFRRTVADLNIDQLNSVFVAVGFPRRDPEKIRVALENTDSLLWVEHAKSGRRPVGFARATGDGVFNAIIWDVVVDPSFQGMGLGKAVMERLVADLLEKGITNIALYSEPRVLGFYRPLGFVADPDGIRGMVYSRKQKKKK
ncbi:Glucosamine-phosphate N-acetyltransferase [Bertholletia excelsa]